MPIPTRRGDLSATARALLHGLSDSVGTSEEKAIAYLEQHKCPPFGPFVHYLSTYGGAAIDVCIGTDFVERIRFPGIEEPHPAEVRWYESIAQWHLDCGDVEGSPVSIEMRPDGALVCYHGSGRWSLPIASSFDVYLEGRSILHHASTNRELTGDFVSTTFSHGAEHIATPHNLAQLPYATDSYNQWWGSSSFGIGSCPSGGASPLTKYRLSLYAFWPRNHGSLGSDLTHSLTGLLEPHLAARRQLSKLGKRGVRDGAECDAQCELPAPDPRPAVSFRQFASRKLRELSGTDAWLAPAPNEGNVLHYLQSCLHEAKARAYSIGIYYSALGLMAFGSKEVADDILNNLPRSTSSVWGEALWGARYLGYLFPVNFQACPVDQTEEARAWLHHNLHRLTWKEDQGQFTFG